MKTIIDDNNTLEVLNKFKGAFAQIWIFSVSHKKMAIRLTHSNKSQTNIQDALYILGISCEYISGPFSWYNSDISITEEFNDDRQLPVFTIEDKSIGFIIKSIGGVGLAIGPESEMDNSFDNFLREH